MAEDRERVQIWPGRSRPAPYLAGVVLELPPLRHTAGQIKVAQAQLHLTQRVVLAEPVPVKDLQQQSLGADSTGCYLNINQ